MVRRMGTVRSKLRKSIMQMAQASGPAIENLETRRLLSAGDPDATFNGGFAEAVGGGALGRAVAVDASNNVLVAGVAGGQLAVARFLSSGTLDASFAGDGVYDTPLGDSSSAEDVVVVGSDIYITGTTSVGGQSDVFVIRLDSTGTLDTDFNASLSQPGDQFGNELAVDGSNIYIAGVAAVGLSLDALVVNINTTGALDPTFGIGGYSVQAIAGNANITGLAVQADGQIVIGGVDGTGVLARFDQTTGLLDPTYGAGGIVVPTVDPFSSIVHIATDGTNIYAVGTSTINFLETVATLRKFDSTGTEVAAFDGDGEAVLDLETSGVNVDGAGVALDGNGSVIISGLILDANTFTISAFVSRFDQTTGALDTEFGVNGVGTQAADGQADAAEVTVDGNQAIVTGGSSTDSLLATRFEGDAVVPPSPVFVDVDGNLVVPGTAGNDTIVLTLAGSNIQVQYNGDDAGTFAFSGSIRIDGLGGNDSITLDSAITTHAEIFGGLGDDTIVSAGGEDFIEGGAGNDSLSGGNGTDIILGGDDNDALLGQGGRDLLIGGNGSDSVIGGADSDVMIGATTDFDGTPESLQAILAAWDTPLPYVLRVVALRILAFRPSNLNDDGSPDTLLGGAGQDWFILDVNQDSSDRVPGELQTNV